jgi:hypothetical protein
MPISKLPTETVDAIIDHLRTDKCSLSACSLTCKQWLPSSQCRLFSDIKVTQRRIRSFLELPASTNIALMVRRLVLDDFVEEKWRDGECIELSAPYKMIQHFLSLLRVEHLQLSNSTSRVITVEMVSALSSVRELEMTNMFFASEEHLFEFIYAFPLLRSLSIVNSDWPYDSSRSSGYNTRPGQPSFSLHSLRVSMGVLLVIAQWLLGLDPVPPIHTLLCAYTSIGFGNVAALLHSVSPSIHTLEIGSWSYSSGDWSDSTC